MPSPSGPVHALVPADRRRVVFLRQGSGEALAALGRGPEEPSGRVAPAAGALRALDIPVDYVPVESDGARTAARILAELL